MLLGTTVGLIERIVPSLRVGTGNSLATSKLGIESNANFLQQRCG